MLSLFKRNVHISASNYVFKLTNRFVFAHSYCPVYLSSISCQLMQINGNKQTFYSPRCGRANKNYGSETCLDATVSIKFLLPHTACTRLLLLNNTVPTSVDPRRPPGWMWYLPRGRFTQKDCSQTWRCWSPWYRLPALPPCTGHRQVQSRGANLQITEKFDIKPLKVSFTSFFSTQIPAVLKHFDISSLSFYSWLKTAVNCCSIWSYISPLSYKKFFLKRLN